MKLRAFSQGVSVDSSAYRFPEVERIFASLFYNIYSLRLELQEYISGSGKYSFMRCDLGLRGYDTLYSDTSLPSFWSNVPLP